MPITKERRLTDPIANDIQIRAAVDALVAEMDAHGRERDGPVRALSGYVGDRWSALILLVLQTGAWRHAELRRTLADISHEGAISQRVLTLKLRGMERDGLVVRTVTNDVPPHVSYALTTTGVGFVGYVRNLIDWINDHAADVDAARAAFDGNTGG